MPGSAALMLRAPVPRMHGVTRRPTSAGPCAAGPSGNGIHGKSHGGGQPPAAAGGGDDALAWAARGFPSYMQNQELGRLSPCDDPGDTVMSASGRQMWRREALIWDGVRSGAQEDAASEPLLSSFLYASILAHDTFEQALAFVLANRLSNATMLPTQLFEIFHSVLRDDGDVRCGALADLEAHSERDPSCCSVCHALLYFKVGLVGVQGACMMSLARV
ncbi:hypothetical protein FOA52_007497 [Chlamydomonas sp. UWO 241]|nr:hypothetical protein FOA52_007497 [Chlamydomonas sp. UWO 241]